MIIIIMIIIIIIITSRSGKADRIQKSVLSHSIVHRDLNTLSFDTQFTNVDQTQAWSQWWGRMYIELASSFSALLKGLQKLEASRVLEKMGTIIMIYTYFQFSNPLQFFLRYCAEKVCGWLIQNLHYLFLFN